MSDYKIALHNAGIGIYQNYIEINEKLYNTLEMLYNSDTGYNSNYFKTEVIDNIRPEEANPAMSISNVNALIPLDKEIKTTLKITTNLTLKANMKGTFHFGLADISQTDFISLDNLMFKQTITKSSSIDETYAINIEQNDEINLNGKYVFAIIKEGTQGISYSTTDIFIQLGKEGVNTRLPIPLNSNFKLLDAVPKGIKIIDFLKSIMTMFNLYMISNPDKENDFIIEPYNAFYSDTINLNTANAIDWSNKIDFSNYKINTNINLPKAYNYNYAEDNDVLNELYKNRYNKGYGSITITDSEGYTEPKETTLIFAPTININHSLDNKSIPIIYKGDGLLRGVKKPFNSKLRILFYNGQIITNEYPVYYRGEELTTFISYGYTSMVKVDTNNITDSLFFDLPNEYFTSNDILTNDSKTLYKQYHQQQIKDITDDNLIILEAKAFLCELDIEKLDFRKPIFIQSPNGNSYFKLLEVEYINSSTTSNVKLQKIVL